MEIALYARARCRLPLSLALVISGCCPWFRPCAPITNPEPNAGLATPVAEEVLRQQRRIALGAGCDSTQLEPWRRGETGELSPSILQIISEAVAARSAQTIALCADPSTSMVPTRTARAQADSLRMTGQVYERYVDQLHDPLPDVYFDFASSRVGVGPDTGAIRLAAEALRNRPEMDLILTGYTDEAGSTDHNLALARLRVASVQRVLVEGHGVAPSRIIAVAFGEARELQIHPRAVRHEPGAELNRRVSFVLVPRESRERIDP